MTIKVKVVLAFLFILVVTISISGLVLFYQSKEIISDRVNFHLSSTKDLQKKYLEQVIVGNKRVLASISSKWQLRRSLRDFQNGNSSELQTMQKILSETLNSDVYIRGVQVTGAQGQHVVSVGDVTKDLSISGDIGLNLITTDRAVLVFRDALKIDETSIGEVVMEVWADRLFNFTKEQSSLGSSQEILLIERLNENAARALNPLLKGELIPDQQKAWNNLLQSPWQSVGKEIIIGTDYKGNSVIAAVDIIEGTSWGVMVKLDQSASFAPILDLRASFLLVILLSALAATFVSLFVANSIIKPLRNLSIAASEIRSGRNAILPSPKGSDEVAILTRSLQHMVDNVTESRNLLENVLDVAPLLLFVKDADGKFLLANSSMASLYGLSVQALIGKNQRDLHLNQVEVENFNRQDKTIVAEGKSIEIARGEFTDSLGKVHILHSIKTPFDFENNRVVLGVAVNISDQVQAEEHALRAENSSKLEKAQNEAKSSFLATMSHELRTPLNSIMGFSQLLQKSDLSAENKINVNSIENAGNHLMRLIGDVLDYSKIEAGELELEHIPVNLVPLLNSALQTVSISAQTSGIDLSFDVDEDISECWVLGDPTRLNQIVLNFLSNGVKYTPEGKVKLKLEVSNDAADFLKIRISVIDNGIGIPEHKLDAVFKSFAQVSSSTTREYGGTGLGLAISKRLALAMGANVGVVSEVGVGSTFYLEGTFEKAEPQEQLGQMEDHEPLPQKNILLVEDIRANQIMMTALLESLGQKLEIANNGKEAVVKVQSNQFDLILMDIHMPEMDGVEATKRIRALSDARVSEIPIFALTADVASNNIREYLAVGMNGHMSKPINLQSLERCLKQI